MSTELQPILLVPPDLLRSAQEFHLPIAHCAYRLGSGPHLFRSGQPIPLRGGLMALDDMGFDGRGDPVPFCREVIQECQARQFTGVVCDFESRNHTALGQLVFRLSSLCQKWGLRCYVPEALGLSAPEARVLLPTALSGGSLFRRLKEATERFGAERVVPAIERVRMDFYLPAPDGQGRELTQQELQNMLDQRAPSVFFSHELCAHYFTYMSKENGAHFVLFDDAASIRKKMQLAHQLGMDTTVLFYPQVRDLLPELLR